MKSLKRFISCYVSSLKWIFQSGSSCTIKYDKFFLRTANWLFKKNLSLSKYFLYIIFSRIFNNNDAVDDKSFAVTITVNLMAQSLKLKNKFNLKKSI